MHGVRSVLPALLLCLGVGGVQAQDLRMLGPVDGANLPPVDTGRVMVGAVAPDFVLPAVDGRKIGLSDYRGEKNVILVFYRGYW